jgi:transcriptional regulator with XRE-family HTH domain
VSATTIEHRRPGRRAKSQAGVVLAAWRAQRRMSQLDLSARSGVTARHVSFVETGRSKPSREMLHTLAAALEMPLRDRNDLFLAAGYAPPYRQLGLDDAGADDVLAAFDRILGSHEPFPGVVMDRHWNLVRANDGARQLFGQLVALDEIESPVNVLRLVFGPLRPFVDNWSELAPALVARARREAVGGVPDHELQALIDELAAQLEAAELPTARGPVIEVAFRIDGVVHRYFSTVTTLGTAVDVDLQELRIELFHPAGQPSG